MQECLAGPATGRFERIAVQADGRIVSQRRESHRESANDFARSVVVIGCKPIADR